MGARRKNKVQTQWSSQLAYAIGVITTDGNLSPDGRHINLTSKDRDMILVFKKALRLSNKIGRKASSGSKIKKYFVIQFGDRTFYQFLESIGLHPAKSKTIGSVAVPSIFFRDFLRGCIDGDGNINLFSHPESRRKQLRVRIVSASKPFLRWLLYQTKANLIKIRGGWIEETEKIGRKNAIYTLCFGKSDALIILKNIYYTEAKYYLKRKFKTAKEALRV